VSTLLGAVHFGVGYYDGDSYLYWYSLYDEEWNYDDLPFGLGDGACIAYQPNVNYNSQMNPVPGWIYCRPGGGAAFWRYAIPTSLPNVALDGIYPGSGAVIADQTPLIQWGNTAAAQYRLLVSTNSLFGDTVLDVVVSNPEYQTTALTNGTYYWRSAAWVSSAWSWSLVHNFQLQGGWQQLDNVTGGTHAGADMAYDGDYLGYQSCIAFRGGGYNNCYAYNIVYPDWVAIDGTGAMDQDPGTSITTHDATEQAGLYPWAAFGGSTTSDNPWYLNGDWTEYVNTSQDPLYYSYFPEDLGPEASMVYGQNHLLYLVVGENNFYALDPPGSLMDGGQAASVRSRGAQAHTVTGCSGIEVEYQIHAASQIRAKLLDAVGRQVAVLDAGEQKPGVHRLGWSQNNEGRRLASGAYFVLLNMGTEQTRLKAVVR
jgi:hypothetical protein